MTKVVIVSPKVVGGEPGDIIDVPDGVNVRGLIKAGAVTLAPEPKPKRKRTTKKAAK